MPSRSIQPVLFLSIRYLMLLICGSVVVVFPCQRSAAQTSSRPKSALTPEARAEKKQLEDKQKLEQAMLRRQAFASIPPDETSALSKEYAAAFAGYREAMTNLDEVRNRQQLSTDPSSAIPIAIWNNWCDAMAAANDAISLWINKAGELYASDPEKYKLMGNTLIEMLLDDVERDRFDPWLGAAKALIQADRNIDDKIRSAAGMVGLAHSDFDFVELCWGPLQKESKLQGNQVGYMNDLPVLREKWKRELEFRQKESQKGDNPLVELMTTKGRIVLELYEDSAPNAVASFIYLIENRFYDNKTFFRVEQHICAQTGCEKGDGTGDAGYQFRGEGSLPDHRHHFRGSVAVALGSDPNGNVNQDSSSSQIYVTFLPMPFLDDTYTVFGRVVKGLPSINLFRVMNLADEKERKEGNKRPEEIISAKVLRKRDHDYFPTISAGKLRR